MHVYIPSVCVGVHMYIPAVCVHLCKCQFLSSTLLRQVPPQRSARITDAGVLGLQMCVAHWLFICALGTELSYKALYPLSHLPGPVLCLSKLYQ